MKNDEEDKFPTQQQRLELRLGTLRLARTFPPPRI